MGGRRQWELLEVEVGRFLKICDSIFNGMPLADCSNLRTFSYIDIFFLVYNCSHCSHGHADRPSFPLCAGFSFMAMNPNTDIVLRKAGMSSNNLAFGVNRSILCIGLCLKGERIAKEMDSVSLLRSWLAVCDDIVRPAKSGRASISALR
jgi:hypothetical protein